MTIYVLLPSVSIGIGAKNQVLVGLLLNKDK